MKSYPFLRSALMSAGLLTLGVVSTFGQAAAPAAPAAPAAQGGGGGGGGRGGGGSGTAGIARPIPEGGLPSESYQPPALNDLEVTAITRIKLQGTMSAAMKAVDAARTELIKATFSAPQTINAKVQALAAAEQALAISRADAFATVIQGYKELTPAKKTAITNSLAGTGGRGGG